MKLADHGEMLGTKSRHEKTVRGIYGNVQNLIGGKKKKVAKELMDAQNVHVSHPPTPARRDAPIRRKAAIREPRRYIPSFA
jgi:3-oxoacyl-ACP reductase-like protein